MTREQFLARCANAYDMGLITPENLRLMERWLDTIMREGHSRLCDHREVVKLVGHDQWISVRQFWYSFGGEVGRLERNSRKRFGDTGALATLANDEAGYAIIRFAAVLANPCDRCATDPNAWHTRGCNCPRLAVDAAATGESQ